MWPANAGREEPDGDRFTDPDYIEPGWTITIPTPPADMGDNAGDNTVPVRDGDTLSQLAADNNVPLDDVVAANIGRVQPDGSALTDPDDIRPGWRIVIPGDVTHADSHGEPPAGESEPCHPADATSGHDNRAGHTVVTHRRHVVTHRPARLVTHRTSPP